jgi:hypothetical protein
MSQLPTSPFHDQQPAPLPAVRGHRLRNTLLGALGGLALLFIGVGIGLAGASNSKPGPAPAVTVTVRAAPAPTVTVTAAPSTAASTPNSQPKPQGNVIIKFSGNGIRNSAPFVVNSSTVTAHYRYDCSAFGTAGNFAADMISGNPSSLSSDDQSIANALGMRGSQTTTLYPTNLGSRYHLEVTSECSWSITLTAG